MVTENIPDRDASLGLIFRLNNLWSSVDIVSVDGNYLKWNNLLDAIYRNLFFDKKIVTDVDEKTGRIIKIDFNESDIDLKSYKHFSLQISQARKSFNHARFKRDKVRTRGVWYHAIQKKDIWLRNYMQKLKLYLKTSEKRPGTSVYGTFRG